MKHDLPLTTSIATNILANSNSKLDAIINHICNGAPMVEPGTIAPTDIVPDPEIPNDVSAQITEAEDLVQTLLDWALNH